MDERTRQVLHSSENFDWQTPPDLFTALDAEFHFDYDAAASEKNALCEHYASAEGAFELLIFDQGWTSRWSWNDDLDGLTAPWGDRTFCNPPYGRGIGAWFAKAYQESLSGKTSVLLVPARTDTVYWHEYAMKAHEVRLIKGRVKFRLPGSEETNSAPFPSAIVIFRPGKQLIGTPIFISWDWRE